MINKGGMRNNIYIHNTFSKFIIEIIYFIIALAQKYQFFFKSPTGATALDFIHPIFLIFEVFCLMLTESRKKFVKYDLV